jgi:hypothetical protein
MRFSSMTPASNYQFSWAESLAYYVIFAPELSLSRAIVSLKFHGFFKQSAWRLLPPDAGG